LLEYVTIISKKDFHVTGRHSRRRLIMWDSFCSSWVKERDDTIVVTGVEGGEKGIENSLNLISSLLESFVPRWIPLLVLTLATFPRKKLMLRWSRRRCQHDTMRYFLADYCCCCFCSCRFRILL
jgi:hypothetical protein